jgi:hypothetical protein
VPVGVLEQKEFKQRVGSGIVGKTQRAESMENRVKNRVRAAFGQKPKMRKRKFALCAFLYALCLVILVGCAAEKPSLVVYSQPFDPAGKTVLIQHFSFNPEVSTSVNKGAVQKFGELIALDTQRFLKSAGFQRSLVVAPGEAAKGDFLITGSITRVYGGDAQKRRFLESTGFGATEVRAVGEVIDLAASRSVAAFSLVKQSSYTWLDNESAVRENLREVAREIAAILIQAK